MNSPRAIRSRLLKYLIPVVIFAISFNVPKFMEAEIKYKANNETLLHIDEDMVEWIPQVLSILWALFRLFRGQVGRAKALIY